MGASPPLFSVSWEGRGTQISDPEEVGGGPLPIRSAAEVVEVLVVDIELELGEGFEIEDGFTESLAIAVHGSVTERIEAEGDSSSLPEPSVNISVLSDGFLKVFAADVDRANALDGNGNVPVFRGDGESSIFDGTDFANYGVVVLEGDNLTFLFERFVGSSGLAVLGEVSLPDAGPDVGNAERILLGDKVEPIAEGADLGGFIGPDLCLSSVHVEGDRPGGPVDVEVHADLFLIGEFANVGGLSDIGGSTGFALPFFA